MQWKTFIPVEHYTLEHRVVDAETGYSSGKQARRVCVVVRREVPVAWGALAVRR